MKKMNLMIALMAVTAGISMNVQAEEAKKQEVVAVVKASAEEQAFTAKLNEQNRKAFEQFTADQKKAAMAACAEKSACGTSACSKSAMNPNEAVVRVLKDQSVAVADKAAPAAAVAAPAQAK